MMLGKVAWCSDWLGQRRIKQVFVDVICLTSWGKPRWNPCHSLIFDCLSISIEGKTANPGYPGKPWVQIYSLMGNSRKTDLCVCVYIFDIL
jgi:hypothetical protein